MQRVFILVLCTFWFSFGCGKGTSQSSNERLKIALARLNAASGEARFRALGDAAKASFDAGNIEDARKYAQELMTMLPDFQQDYDYGRAMHDANIVLGRIAVREDHLEDAKRYLLQSGQTPGTPAMMNYGPNLSLAKDLLDKGEKQVVLDYLEHCGSFWRFSGGRLDRLKRDISEGKKPDFGPNLTY